MKHSTSILILCVLPLLAGCTADLSMTRQGQADAAPVEAVSTHQVHYRATVQDDRGDGDTRAALDAEKGYVFTAGDLLFVRGKDDNADKVYGVLYPNESDYWKNSGITFEGDLTVVDGFEDQDGYEDTPLEAVLVGAESQLYTFNAMGNQIAEGPTWPTDGVLSTSVAQAAERYSTLTAECTYGQQSFQLSQGSCFVNFSVTLDDGTAAGTEIGAYVWTDNADGEAPPTDIRSGTVTTVQDGEAVKANFVAAFPAGTVLDGAVVGFGDRHAIGFSGSTSKTLEANKIYKVKKTFTRSEASISYDKTAVVKSNPDVSFTNPLTNTGQGNETVTYESSNPSVATVEASGENAGLVTIVGPGTATITATVQDGVNYVYSEHAASYDLTVYDPVSLDINETNHATVDHVGWVIGTDGKAYVTYSGVSAAGKIPVAMIGYVGEPGTADAGSETYRGLAIALGDATTTSVSWSSSPGVKCTTNGASADFATVIASMTGIGNTTRLVTNACSTGHTHAAAVAASAYDVPFFTPADFDCSEWFLPSTGQWYKVFQGCGVATQHWNGCGWCPDSDGKSYYDNPDDNNCGDNFAAIQNLMTAAGGSFSERYWTSTEYAASPLLAFYVMFGASEGVGISFNQKGYSCNVRAFIAF